ncbi:MAG: GspH/FimT family pseudopilin [Kangiellaceae bacterium]|nr:GspH/FimT family pseudopilin [Kangiellaceae bacterium]MCW8998194.1 GspH/FimT family pseudopilin [Kangiellaceae bacterium]
MKQEFTKGFTLIDLLFALAILAILINIAVPAFSDLIKKGKIKSESSALYSVLQASRVVAVESNEKVTICPTQTGETCTSEWSNGYLAFIDNNGNRRIDENETVLFQKLVRSEDISLRWRAFGVRSSMQWLSSGITNHQNGYFEFCFQGEPTLARALIISKSGRIRRSADTNGNQIHENSQDDDIVCS